MKELNLFNDVELNSLELIEIKGGRSMLALDSVNVAYVCTGDLNCGSQNSCSNDECTNSGNCVAGCGCSPK